MPHPVPHVTDIELHALIISTQEVPQIAPGLLAWIEGACDWELNRRAGHVYELLPPEAAIKARGNITCHGGAPRVSKSQRKRWVGRWVSGA